MTNVATLSGAIIAAGAGSRLRGAGWEVPKALVRVAGSTLIEHVVGNFRAAGIRSLAIIVNQQSRECVAWTRARFPDLDLRFVVKTTASSLESFLAVQRDLDLGPTLISTVDAWCLDGAFGDFVNAARDLPDHAVVLAVTPFVDDERPLWVRTAADGRITELGCDAGDQVTAGLYLIPERIRGLEPPAELSRLREFLAWLVARGEPVYGVSLAKVIDVDRPRDIGLVEASLDARNRAARDLR